MAKVSEIFNIMSVKVKARNSEPSVFSTLGVEVPKDLKCPKCEKDFKSHTGFKSHYVYKHSDFKRKRGKGVDRMRHERLADLTLETIRHGEPLNKKQLLMLSGYTGATLTKNVKQPFTSQGFQDALARRGVTADSIVSVLEEAAKAKQGSWYQGVYYEEEAPDHGIRIKAADKLMDATGLKKRVIEQRTVNVNLSGDDLRQMIGLD